LIQITRALARRVRAVLRKSMGPAALRNMPVCVILEADAESLRIRLHHEEVAVEYTHAGSHPVDTLALPLQALDDFEGRQDAPVTLETTASGSVQARWDDGGVPQVKDYPAPERPNQRPFPQTPQQLHELEPGLLTALHEAAQTTGESPRYAVHRVQLRGSSQDIVATDGRQLLIQGGFSFPWKEDLLVPALETFLSREIPQDAPVSAGKTETHVCFRIGPWTFFLASDTQGRFPEADKVLPSLTGPITTWKLAEQDALFLAKALPRLPGRELEDAPTTVDLNGQVAVRAQGEGQSRITEVVLSQSEVGGAPVRFRVNRQYLARTLRLGFRELCITKADVPVLCRDAQRKFVWQPLGPDGALQASTDALRIASPDNGPASSAPSPQRSQAMPRSPSHGSIPEPSAVADNGPARERQTTEPSNPGGVIAEAQAFQESLRETYSRASRLVAALKRQRKQSRLVASTLASLRELQPIEA
jgi:hypothetical protein